MQLSSQSHFSTTTGAFVRHLTPSWSLPVARPPAYVCFARLPHMDEEIEHMQWQLRSLDGDNRHRSNSSSSSRKGRNNKPPQQHVFHERGSNSSRLRYSGTTQQADSPSGQLNSQQGQVAAALPEISADADCLQNFTAEGSTDVSVAFHHLQLQAAGQVDINKAIHKLLKHIQHDGGCYLSADVGQAGMLTNLLLLLQREQVLQVQGSLLVMQPAMPELIAVHSSTGSSSSSAVRQLCFWVTAMPADLLLISQQEAGACVASSVGAISSNTNAAGHSSDSHQSWQSSSDDLHISRSLAAGASSRTTTTTSNTASPKRTVVPESAVLQAAERCSSSMSTVLQQTAADGRLQRVRLAPNSNAEAIAMSMAQQVQQGFVSVLQVRGDAVAAQATAYTAFGMAAGSLLAIEPPRDFVVMLVPAALREHVHVAAYGHVQSNKLDSKAASTIGGFAAPFYGLSSLSSDEQQLSARVQQYNHAQGAWMCVMPLPALC